ncbi:hypothetical protein HCN44_002930 [Aphidius gifuensis]|uniref:Ras-related protein Rab-24 n=1 Tax=Aphidius gifuensis TaxID=684658 RepID=A0A835CRM5_APHGI|nr:ras-related protein Rab-24-like [Aphidius gifuensis]KAF7991368.1 hypothetical protein HCN44_002930 [Aphidius gifuensis]
MTRVDFKVVLLGQSLVGKTSLIERFVNERFYENLAFKNTIGAAYTSKQINVDEKTLVLGIWDTAGSERYEAMVRIYYRGAKAAIVCYDVTDQSSFNKAKYWIRELRSIEEKCKIYLCATKKDLLNLGHDATPSLETVDNYAAGIQSKFFLTSSKTGEMIDEMFIEIGKDYLSDPENQTENGLVNIILSGKKNDSSGCCGGSLKQS